MERQAKYAFLLKIHTKLSQAATKNHVFCAIFGSLLVSLSFCPPILVMILHLPWFVVAFIGLLSLCVGSFLNVVIYRLSTKWQLSPDPSPVSFWFPRSVCPHCRKIIAWYDNIPLFSFACLKGRCRHCHQAISLIYPAVEISTLILASLLLYQFGGTAKTLFTFAICCWLIPLAVLDFKYFILPNELTISLIAFGLLINATHGLTSWPEAVIGAAAGYLTPAIIDRLYYLWRKQHGIGQGDWKLLAALGACFGWPSMLWILFLACFLGSLAGIALMIRQQATLQSPLAFGVFLSVAAVVQLFIPYPFFF